MAVTQPLPPFESGPAALQWKRLKKLNLVGAKLEYLTAISPTDRLLAATVLKLFPRSFSPNRITIFRFICIPVAAFLLLSERSGLGLAMFVLAAFSDALDGAIARTQHRITKWGIIADPIADKLLVGTTAAIIVTKYLGFTLAAAIVGIELLLVASSYFRYRGRVMPAKTIGKLKMVLQCVGIGFVLLYSVLPEPLLLLAGQYTLYAAVVFAFLSLLVYRSI